ncbi:MAG: hypothetical protein PHV30_11610 [Candidatus Margulisbacteria bacterium]|nr:hypothetical protein [Candidatus Margulisiibacteriota bacterium]
MEVRRPDSVQGAGYSGPVKGENLSVLGAVSAFLFALFRKKKDKNKFSKDEQIIAGIIASEELMDQVNEEIASKKNKE